MTAGAGPPGACPPIWLPGNSQGSRAFRWASKDQASGIGCDTSTLLKWNSKGGILMKKWPFWLLMLAVSLLNGAIFYMASASAMNRGLDGVDNQAGLLLIPILWLLAIFVLIALHTFTLVQGRKIAKNQRLALWAVFQRSGLSARESVWRAVWITTTCLLMVLGYRLFAAEKRWAVSYALSGGALLLLLYAWEKAAVQSGRGTG